MNCRGHDTRIEIVNKYILFPIAHLQLLNGQQKKSDAGPIIENDYYIFRLVNKGNESDVRNIVCGIEAASDFLNLIHHKPLPIFNPLVSGRTEQNINNNSPSFQNGKINNETAKQLYNATMWVILIINARINSPIFKIKNNLEKNMNYEPYLSIIKSVNTIIKSCFKEKTLSDKINELRKSNNIRNSVCNFSLLQEKLKNVDITSNF